MKFLPGVPNQSPSIQRNQVTLSIHASSIAQHLYNNAFPLPSPQNTQSFDTYSLMIQVIWSH